MMVTRERASHDSARPAPPAEQGFAPGDVLFAEGDAADRAFLLLHGTARVVRRVGADERCIRYLRAGDLCGEAALTPAAEHRSTVIAISEGAALVLRRGDAQAVLAEQPALAARLVAQLAERLAEAEDQVTLLLLRDARTRVVRALLQLLEASPAAAGPSGAPRLAVSPLELAARTGVPVDAVKRAVQELRSSGQVHLTEEQLEVPDAEALRELADLLELESQIARSGWSVIEADGRR